MDTLYSVRMRAARGSYHISGAERLVPWQEVQEVVAGMLQRARIHERGAADFINVMVEKIEGAAVPAYPALPVTTVRTADYEEGRGFACRLLEEIGIAPDIVRQAVRFLTDPAQQMRGAIVLDMRAGLRLDEDPERGIRASRMDAVHNRRAEFARRLEAAGLPDEHTREALILATKVSITPGVAAELCWSDDPCYTAGYVAAKKYGYVRFPHLKPSGLAQGGRVFFFDPQAGDYAHAVRYLEKQPVLIEPVQRITPPVSWEDFVQAWGLGTRE